MATVYTLVLGTRLSPLLEGLGPPPARPRPGPGRSRPRRTNPARTTSRPVTRTSRRTGDPPPTPHHVLGTRRTQLSTRTTPSPDAAGPTGASGDSDTNTKARRNKDVWAGRPGMTTPSTCHGAPPGRSRHHRPKTAPHGPATGNWEVSHPKSTGTRAGPRPSPRGKIVNRPSELNACLGPIMPRTRSSSLEHSRLKTTRPSRHMISRPSRLMTTRPRASRLHGPRAFASGPLCK